MSGVLEIVEAFVGREVVDRDGDGDGVPEAVDGPLGHFAKRAFDFGEDLLDGIEIGAIGGREPSFGAGGFGGLADAGDLMGAAIVPDDDFSGAQLGARTCST